MPGPKYRAGMKIRNDDFSDPACYGLMYILGFSCRVRCSWRAFCKTKSTINKNKEVV